MLGDGVERELGQLGAGGRFDEDFWQGEGLQIFENLTGHQLTGLLETVRKLHGNPSMPYLGAPKSPPRPSRRKCSCGLDSCIDGLVCQGAGCFPDELSNEEWLRLIQPSVAANDVSCTVCRAILEDGIPTVICLPRQLSAGCRCESSLKAVLETRKKGKQGQFYSMPPKVLEKG